MKQKVIAFIPIRKNSKSIKDKNIKSFCGRPLIYWTTYALQQSKEVDKIYIALDSEKYARIIEDFQFDKVCIYFRDDRNARDSSTTESVSLEFLNAHIEYINDGDIFMLVQVTSPFTTSKQFDDALDLYKEKKYDSMLSCCIFKRFLWNRNGIPLNYDPKSRPLKQQWSGSFLENGSFYINRVINILRDECRIGGKIGIYVLPEWHQYEIDSEYDWIIMEQIFKKEILKCI